MFGWFNKFFKRDKKLNKPSVELRFEEDDENLGIVINEVFRTGKSVEAHVDDNGKLHIKYHPGLEEKE